MKRMKRKTRITNFGAWQYLGSEIEKAIKDEPGESIASSSIIAVMTVAICPAALPFSVITPKARELAKRFAEFYYAKPDLTLSLIKLIRRKWKPASVTDKARKYALTQAWHVRGQRDRVIMNDASISEIQFAIDPKLPIKAAKLIEKVLREPKRLNLPVFEIKMTRELYDALQELRQAGFDIGWGS